MDMKIDLVSFGLADCGYGETPGRPGYMTTQLYLGRHVSAQVAYTYGSEKIPRSQEQAQPQKALRCPLSHNESRSWGLDTRFHPI